jgi:hypothetical protein
MLSETWVESGILENLKLDPGYGGQKSTGSRIPEQERQPWHFLGSIIKYALTGSDFYAFKAHPKS